jgi:hypothetical protein
VSTSQYVPSIVCPSPVLGAGKQGIKRIAVDDAAAQLLVTFWAPLTAAQNYLLQPLNYSLSGGQRLFPRVISAVPGSLDSPPDLDGASVLLNLDQIGDFSVYTLTVSGADIDPFFSSAKLRFRLSCEDSFDCRVPAALAAPASEVPVTIDYLSKDYAGFRQALLDFIPTRLPAWTERSEADLGMVLVELFAATADSLSYLQDRVANEAFLSTALQRRSVAGHLALIGYQMDDGASAVTYLQFQVSAAETLPSNPGFKVSNQPTASSSPILVFETLGAATLAPASNAMSLYDWGNQGCCLSQSSVTAALTGKQDQLRAGDYLLFDDGDGNRDIVRLTAAPQFAATDVVTSPPSADAMTIVTWSAATPLRHCYPVAQTIVRGNVVPATHGETVTETQQIPSDAVLTGIAATKMIRPARQRLALSNGPLAYLDIAMLGLGMPLGKTAVAAGILDRTASSTSTLRVEVDNVPWTEMKTLLNSGPADKVFRIELDDEGNATLVFGDGTFGAQLPAGATVSLTYRVGGGAGGNIGADTLTLAHPTSTADWLTAVTNPLAAAAGRDLESSDHARKAGPPGIHQPLVAVTPEDFQTAAVAFTDVNGNALIQRANASFRWSGSWLTVTLSVDPIGTEGLTAELEAALLTHLESKRMAGYDLEILGPAYVAVDMQVQFTAASGSFPDDVEQALLAAMSSGKKADGSLGFFHPDNFTFGDGLYVSAIYAAMMAVPGVQSAQVIRLARQHAAQPAVETTANLKQGFLSVGQDQIIRLDNDRNFPQNGTLTITAKGGAK